MGSEPASAAIYARVSTTEQDVQRQLRECRDHLERNFPSAENVDEYYDTVSGADEDGGRYYQELWNAIERGEYDVVVVHEISRLSRLGPTEVNEFISHALEHETSVESLDINLSIHIDDPELQQTVYTMVANIMADLAKIEHQQKLDRIRSGISAARSQGKWTGRPPLGFRVEDGYLRVDVEEYLEVVDALKKIDSGESIRSVANRSPFNRRTLGNLYRDRRELYLEQDTEDDRIEEALGEIDT